MTKQMKTIDLRKLAQNFAKEKSKEELYWQRNDAKFRAVHQRCENYEEFRQIVQAAHLRPLERKETLNFDKRQTVWNQTGKQSSQENSSSFDSPISNSISATRPKNHIEFQQQWRRLNDQGKIEFLHRIENFENLFQLDVPTDLVQDLTNLFTNESSNDDARIILDLLFQICKSKRFDLTKNFFDQNQIFRIDQLFSRISRFAEFRYSVFLLRSVYL